MNSGDSRTSGAAGSDRLSRLLQKFQTAPSATAAERAARDQVLDELQDAVGMSGKMATEADIVRRAKKLLGAG